MKTPPIGRQLELVEGRGLRHDTLDVHLRHERDRGAGDHGDQWAADGAHGGPGKELPDDDGDVSTPRMVASRFSAPKRLGNAIRLASGRYDPPVSTWAWAVAMGNADARQHAMDDGRRTTACGPRATLRKPSSN
jgi:hypothetical protein